MPDPQEDKRLYALWKRRRSRQQFVLIPFLYLIFWIYWTRSHPDTSIMGITSFNLGVLAIGSGVLAIVMSLINWRCPACNRYLGKYYPKVCGHCGFVLRREN